MLRFSANLGFLWNDRALPDAIGAAAAAGFDAVECHWPYEIPAEQVREALAGTGLAMLGLNTVRGDVSAGENGLAAMPGREADARSAIDQALEYADAIDAGNIHVMAGIAIGEEAEATYVENLRYASERAASAGRTILIEPLNERDAPGYFLRTSDQAVGIIDHVGAPNLKLMFDCYHVQIMEGDITRRLEGLMPHIGHIQIAAVPDRKEPDHGELDYRYILDLLQRLGYDHPIGAEYRPAASVEAGLGWLERARSG
jgi:hydroxypyruvate isomerase